MSDFEITEAMIRLGGGFVSGLGQLFRHADSDNQRRLRNAFPEYWKTYAELAAMRPSKE